MPSPRNLQDTLVLVSGMSDKAQVVEDMAIRQVCERKILCNVLNCILV